MLGLLIARLEALVPDLAHRIDGAAAFTRLMESKTLPSGGVRAYVLPTGTGGRARPVVSLRRVGKETSSALGELVCLVTDGTMTIQALDAAGNIVTGDLSRIEWSIL